jgi:PmbA protein
MCVVRRDGKTGSYAEFDVGRRREDVDLERVGELAARGALRYLGPRKIPGGEMPLVVGPLTIGGFLESLACAACAEPIQRGRSFLAEKVGKRLAPQSGPGCLTLEDDGRFPAGLHSSSRDGEGVPRRPLLITERGVFANMLHNSYTAGKAGVKSTGHGSQLGGTSPTNLRPHVGTRPAASMIADLKDGLYIDSSMLSPDPVTGEISATVDWAMKIESGELAFPVTGIAVTGSMLDMLSSLEEISSDYREEPGCVLPTMLFGKIRVVS